MDIDQHVNQIVQNLVAEITTKVQQQAAAAVDFFLLASSILARLLWRVRTLIGGARLV